MEPKISLIVAMADNRVIGKQNDIPWNIPGEQKRFKEITTGHPIIMGRKTYESIGRVLPNRPNIIITRDENFKVDGATVCHNLDEALVKARELDQDEIFVIGGGQIYQEAMPIAHRLYLTRIHKQIDGEVFFPDYSKFTKVVSTEEHEMEDGTKYSYSVLEE
jgi:dihydrofolate reductase